MPQAEIPVAPMVRHCSSLLRQRLHRPESCPGLVVGCGSGDEVAYLRRTFPSGRIVGVDLARDFSSLARAEACVLTADAQTLPFPAEAFDFVAAFHSLEHVGDPHLALAEIRRVLRPDGWFYLGVPNRSRVVGYLGSSDASAWQKLTWNLTDYRARLLGRFENKSGAHAGFRRQELVGLLRSYFGEVELLTEAYLRFKYAGRVPKPMLNFLLAPRLIDYSAPAHYALCRKRG
jgi:SAM-dependent methyltransferase